MTPTVSNLVRKFTLPSLVAGGLALSACSTPSEPQPDKPSAPEPEQKVVLEEIAFNALPGFAHDSLLTAAPALTRSCERILKRPADAAFSSRSPYGGQVSDWHPACESFKTLPENDETALRSWMVEHFTPYSVAYGGQTEGLFTGYFEASLKGSYQKDSSYRYPLYPVPDDLVRVKLEDFDSDLKGKSFIGRFDQNRFKPYFDRKAIDEGAIQKTAKPIIWSNDPVDVFFLHIQGSGQVELPDGSKTRVGFAGSNGLPFYAIGRALIDEGWVSREEASMQSIRNWLRANPDDAQMLMQRNKRFIFFREIEGNGPIGAYSVPLTAERSLAVDPSFIPLGAPLWLDTTFPAGAGKRAFSPLQRLMVAQDTGSAIKGAVRGDFYWGSGEAALALAGGMKQKGRYFLLLPKTVSAGQ